MFKYSPVNKTLLNLPCLYNFIQISIVHLYFEKEPFWNLKKKKIYLMILAFAFPFQKTLSIMWNFEQVNEANYTDTPTMNY